MMKILSCEQVSNGHPDKICDQISDAVVADCLKHDPDSRVAVECLIKDHSIIIAGELTSKHKPDYKKLVDEVFTRIGKDRLGYSSDFNIHVLVREQSPDIALGVDKGGAGDQGIMYGYATNETPELLPIPFVVATYFLQMMKDHPSPVFKADMKSQCTYNYDTGKIEAFLCSVQHDPSVDVKDFRDELEFMMKAAAYKYGLNADFVKLINPTGRFAIGGPFADCGVTGRKLACDTYGGIGRIGGGALSGKDPSKVDRSGAYMARKIARDIVQAGFAARCEIQIAYAIGLADPVSVNIDCFDTECQHPKVIESYVRESYDLTPRGMIDFLHLKEVDYNTVSAYGHFGKPGLPWEQ